MRDRYTREGTIAFNVRSSDGITSGYIRGGAIYHYDWGFNINSVSFGFSFGDVDFDKCNHMFITNGYIENPTLFFNLASEYTYISDVVFNHSGRVGGFGITTGVGKSTDHRVIVKGEGVTYLKNMSLNTLLLSDGKRVISQQGSGRLYLDESINPNDIGWSAESTGKVFSNGVEIEKFNNVSYDSYTKISLSTNITHNIRLTGSKKILLTPKLALCGGIVTYSNILDGVSCLLSISKVTQLNESSIKFQKIGVGGVEKISVLDESIVIDFSSLKTNTIVSLTVPSSFAVSTP